MIIKSPKYKKTVKGLMDFELILVFISFISALISLFLKNKISYYVAITIVAALILLRFFIYIFIFTKKSKKWNWLFLESLIIIGPVIKGLANYILVNLLDYAGTTLLLIGLASFITFYILFYRKYLSGELSLEDFGIKEKTLTKEEQEKNKKQDKIGWIMIIILFLILIGVFLYLHFR